MRPYTHTPALLALCAAAGLLGASTASAQDRPPDRPADRPADRVDPRPPADRPPDRPADRVGDRDTSAPESRTPDEREQAARDAERERHMDDRDDDREDRRARKGSSEIGVQVGGAGDTIEGHSFAMNARYEYWLTEHISLGPLVQMEVDHDLFQIGPTLQLRGVVPVPGAPRLQPSAQVGLGFLYADADRHHDNRGDDDDLGFLAPFGVGLAYEVTDHVLIGTDFLANITDVFHDEFFWTWTAGLSYRF